MKYLETIEGREAVRVIAVGPYGFDWESLDGRLKGTMCNLPLTDENGKQVAPTPDPGREERLAKLEAAMAEISPKLAALAAEVTTLKARTPK